MGPHTQAWSGDHPVLYKSFFGPKNLIHRLLVLREPELYVYLFCNKHSCVLGQCRVSVDEVSAACHTNVLSDFAQEASLLSLHSYYLSLFHLWVSVWYPVQVFMPPLIGCFRAQIVALIECLRWASCICTMSSQAMMVWHTFEGMLCIWGKTGRMTFMRVC